MMLPNTTNTGETHPGRTPNLNVRHRAIFFSLSGIKKTTTRSTKLWFQSTQITSYMTIQTISVSSHELRVFCPATLILIVHPPMSWKMRFLY